jgi:hypothetical protein
VQDHVLSLVKNKPGEPLRPHVTMQAIFLIKRFNWKTKFKTVRLRVNFLLVSSPLRIALLLHVILQDNCPRASEMLPVFKTLDRWEKLSFVSNIRLCCF